MARKKEYPLRIDVELFSEIQRWAADEFRSVNGQMEYLLRQAVARRRKVVPEIIEAEGQDES